MLVPLALTWLMPTQALDLAYQIRAGEWMLDNAGLLDVDVFTYTVFGEPWLNQQWAAQLVYGLAFRAGGWPAMELLRGGVVALTAFLLYRACRAVGAGPRFAFVLTLAGMLVASTATSELRPQQFGVLLLAITVWSVATRRQHPMRVWIVPITTLVWANIHGSFPLALVVVAFAALEDRSSDGARRTAWAFVTTAVATCITPYGPLVWRYIVDVARHPIVDTYMVEWQPLNPFERSGFAFTMSVIAVLVTLFAVRRHVTRLQMVQVVTYLAVSVVAARGVIAWAIAVPVLMASMLARDTPVADAPPARRAGDRVAWAGVAALLLVSVVAVTIQLRTDPRSGAPAMLTHAPERLVIALREAVPPGSNVFASQFHAPWAEFSAPEMRYMIDSRIELFPLDIWQRYIAIAEGEPGWDDALDALEVDALLLEPGQSVGLRGALEHDATWRLVEQDDDGYVYVRSTAVEP
jgi:hypothetical protein